MFQWHTLWIEEEKCGVLGHCYVDSLRQYTLYNHYVPQKAQSVCVSHPHTKRRDRRREAYPEYDVIEGTFSLLFLCGLYSIKVKSMNVKVFKKGLLQKMFV